MNQKVRYHVACCTDDNYVQACGVLLCSLFENNPNSRFHVHILIEEISEKKQAAFSFVGNCLRCFVYFSCRGCFPVGRSTVSR